MYLVELRPGKEELYRTGDDLALAIRDGDVDARSRIYHRATAKWISITLHPQYKAIVAGQDGEPVRPARKTWGLLPSPPDQADETSPPAEVLEPGAALQRWKHPLGLGISSILLVLGVQLAFSGPRPPWAGGDRDATVWNDQTEQGARDITRLPIVSEESEPVALAATSLEWDQPQPPADTAASPARKAPTRVRLPRPPRLRQTALRASLAAHNRSTKVKPNSVQSLLERYEVASDSALARLEAGMRVARLHRLFSAARLTPGGGVTDTRLNLAGAVNLMRVFRQQQAGIDQAYQDSVRLLAKRHKWTRRQVRQWYARTPRAESATLELVSSTLIAEIDSILGVLDSNAGAYKLRGTAIAFEDPAAGQVYGALRRSIKSRMEEAIADGGASSPGPAGLLLQAIGNSSLPRET